MKTSGDKGRKDKAMIDEARKKVRKGPRTGRRKRHLKHGRNALL